MKYFRKIISCAIFASIFSLASCKDAGESKENEFVKPEPKRSFELFDAMFYTQKPDFSSVGIQPIQLLYENKLLSGSAIDWEIVANTIANTKASKCGKNGSLTVQFNLSNNTAKGVKAVGGSFAGTATEKCILTVVEKYRWPDGTASGSKYPFKF